MVEVLGDHFPELKLEIVFESGVGHPGSHEGNLFPYDIASSVGFFEHEMRLRIVGKS